MIDLLETIPPSEITAISVVPPPMSTIMFPSGASTSRPIPNAAAMGSKIIYTSRPPACSAESRTARISTSVLPEGIQITTRNEGENRPPLFLLAILIIPRIICSAALKSAITPSLNGLTVRIFSCVFPCICLAFSPKAIILSVLRSNATMEGSSSKIFPALFTMTELAVPRSIANSCVNENKPII